MSDVSPHSLTILGRRGRRPRAEAPSVVKTIRLSPCELARVEKALRINHQDFSDFARLALGLAAEDCLEDEPS